MSTNASAMASAEYIACVTQVATLELALEQARKQQERAHAKLKATLSREVETQFALAAAAGPAFAPILAPIPAPVPAPAPKKTVAELAARLPEFTAAKLPVEPFLAFAVVNFDARECDALFEWLYAEFSGRPDTDVIVLGMPCPDQARLDPAEADERLLGLIEHQVAQAARLPRGPERHVVVLAAHHVLSTYARRSYPKLMTADKKLRISVIAATNRLSGPLPEYRARAALIFACSMPSDDEKPLGLYRKYFGALTPIAVDFDPVFKETMETQGTLVYDARAAPGSANQDELQLIRFARA